MPRLRGRATSIVPLPLATFAGYLVYGLAGAVVATLAVFLLVYLFVVIPGPWFRKHEKHPRLQGFVKGATAAAAGAIAGAAIVIGRQTITDPLTVAIYGAGRRLHLLWSNGRWPGFVSLRLV